MESRKVDPGTVGELALVAEALEAKISKIEFYRRERIGRDIIDLKLWINNLERKMETNYPELSRGSDLAALDLKAIRSTLDHTLELDKEDRCKIAGLIAGIDTVELAAEFDRED